MSGSAPEWAVQRALSMCAYGQPREGVLLAFARYIAEHEEPPVDPIEVEVARLLPHANDHPLEVVIRTALKAGVKLAKEQP